MSFEEGAVIVDKSKANNSTRLQKKVTVMMSLQDEMNKKVHSDWIAQNFEWYRAAWIECGELMDHLGYKWWKKQIADVEQVKLEIVDIWHFAMSSYFTPEAAKESEFYKLCDKVSQEIEQVSSLLAANVNPELSGSDWNQAQKKLIRQATEVVAESSLARKQVSVDAFWQLLVAAGLDLDSLYTAYIGKNVLNQFRQDKGYKQGHYQKTWHGREDNEHLAELVNSLDPDDDDFQKNVYTGLETVYASL